MNNVAQQLFDPKVTPERFAFLAKMREENPLFRFEANNLTYWAATRYEDVRQLLVDERFGFGELVDLLDSLPDEDRKKLQRMRKILDTSFANLNLEEHQALRKVVMRYFNPSDVRDWRPMIERIAEELLSGCEEKGSMEFVNDFASPLPVAVIAEILGAPREEQHLFVKWSVQMYGIFRTYDFEVFAEAQQGIVEMYEYCEKLLEEKIASPGDDLISYLAEAVDKGEISRATGLTTCLIMLFAGHETTTQVMSNGLVALLEHPDQLTLLRDNSSLMVNAVKEILRYNSVASWLRRVAKEDVEMGGVTIRKGDHVLLSHISANRDGEVYEDPDKFDISRKQGKAHLSFGMGLRYCVGNMLARQELEIGLQLLLNKFPRLALVSVTYNDLPLLDRPVAAINLCLG